MTAPAAPTGAPNTLPDPSANGSAPPTQTQAQTPRQPKAPARTRIRSMHTTLVAGIVILIVVVIFVIQNASAVNISFLGAHLRLSLAVALLLAVIGGALVMAAAGTARITQLRRIMRRDRNRPTPGQ
jgi:putative membrane protein